MTCDGDVASPAIDAAEHRTRARDEAFERLFAAEYRRVVAIAARVLGRMESAEDVAQDVFVAFARRYAPDAPFAAPWLHTAAAHTALNVIRGEKRRRSREAREAILRDSLDDAGAVAADPLRCALASEHRDEVRRALARLPRHHATLLALRYGGLAYREIAEAIGVKPASVGTMLARAEAAFAKAFDA